MIIASSIRQASKHSRANQLYAQKAMTYERFIELWEKLLLQGYASEDRRPSQLSEELQTLDGLLTLYASPAVLKGAHRASSVSAGKWDAKSRCQVPIRQGADGGTQGSGLGHTGPCSGGPATAPMPQLRAAQFLRRVERFPTRPGAGGNLFKKLPESYVTAQRLVSCMMPTVNRVRCQTTVVIGSREAPESSGAATAGEIRAGNRMWCSFALHVATTCSDTQYVQTIAW